MHHVAAAVYQLHSYLDCIAAIVVVINQVIEVDAGEVVRRVGTGELLASLIGIQSQPFQREAVVGIAVDGRLYADDGIPSEAEAVEG